jgi:hypothetical protein
MYSQFRGTRPDVALHPNAGKVGDEGSSQSNPDQQGDCCVGVLGEIATLPTKVSAVIYRGPSFLGTVYRSMYTFAGTAAMIVPKKPTPNCVVGYHNCLRCLSPTSNATRKTAIQRGSERMSICLTHRRLYSFRGPRASYNNREAPDPGPR